MYPVMIRRWCALVSVGLLASLLVSGSTPVSAWLPGVPVDVGVALSPGATLSTSGDFATDTFSDPWDFSNPEDVNPTHNTGVGFGNGESLGGGTLSVASRNGTEIRLLMKWPKVLPWGHDGWAHPIDAGRYTQTTFRIYSDTTLYAAIRFQNAAGQWGVIPFTLQPGWSTQHFDLLDRSLYPASHNPDGALWSGPIVRFELFRGGSAAGDAQAMIQLDWARVHRADAPRTPPAGVPIPVVVTPSIEGGADYATTELGNPWDFNGLDDFGESHDVANLAVSNGELTGVSTRNDPYIGLPLGPTLNTDRYHHLTVDACYGGAFDLGGAPGQGMVGRMAWMPEDPGRQWTETQDFVVFPGCHRMSFDMATQPAGAIHDEDSVRPVGWRGVRPTSFRFDLNEDPGVRNFTLREVRLADDAAFTSTYPISFYDAAATAGATADIFVTTTRGAYNGTQIARGIPVTGGINTFTWNGTNINGARMSNATYWVYVVMNGISSGSGVGYSTGPVRLEVPVAPTPSYYVPLTPSRLLDTRTGEGGNISPLSQGVFTELDVTGVAGVPETDVTAVVMNVTVTSPTEGGWITAWPSGEPQPDVSNLNFAPGQTVPNLVTVKTGANGRVNLFNSTGRSHVIADIAGYYTNVPPQSGGLFTALTPSRLLDTRDGTGTGGSRNPVGPASAINVNVLGLGGVPTSGVSGVALNVTVDQPTSTGFLTVWPAGENRPNASTHNFTPGVTGANLVLAKVGAGGQVSIFNSDGTTHVIADVIGYFSNSGGAFVPVAPKRIIDTRSGVGGPAAQVGPGGVLAMAVANASPVPPSAKAVIVNITTVNSTSGGFITVWPTGAGQPLASTLNPRPGSPVPNQAYLRLGSGGSLNAFNAAGSTDIIVDVFGYVP